MSEHKPRLYMNAGAQRMMKKAFELMDEMRATGRKDLVGEICSLCGYEGVAEQLHTCPSSGWYPDEEGEA